MDPATARAVSATRNRRLRGFLTVVDLPSISQRRGDPARSHVDDLRPWQIEHEILRYVNPAIRL